MVFTLAVFSIWVIVTNFELRYLSISWRWQPFSHHRSVLCQVGSLNLLESFAWGNERRGSPLRQNGAHLSLEYWRYYLASYFVNPSHCRTHRISSRFVAGSRNGERGTAVCWCRNRGVWWVMELWVRLKLHPYVGVTAYTIDERRALHLRNSLINVERSITENGTSEIAWNLLQNICEPMRVKTWPVRSPSQ